MHSQSIIVVWSRRAVVVVCREVLLWPGTNMRHCPLRTLTQSHTRFVLSSGVRNTWPGSSRYQWLPSQQRRCRVDGSHLAYQHLPRLSPYSSVVTWQAAAIKSLVVTLHYQSHTSASTWTSHSQSYTRQYVNKSLCAMSQQVKDDQDAHIIRTPGS